MDLKEMKLNFKKEYDNSSRSIKLNGSQSERNLQKQPTLLPIVLMKNQDLDTSENKAIPLNFGEQTKKMSIVSSKSARQLHNSSALQLPEVLLEHGLSPSFASPGAHFQS